MERRAVSPQKHNRFSTLSISGVATSRILRSCSFSELIHDRQYYYVIGVRGSPAWGSLLPQSEIHFENSGIELDL